MPFDKTVVVKFQDALDMMRFCNETPDDIAPISKKFLDWYLIDGTFTIPAGVLILEDIQGNEGKNLCMSFDFTDVENPHFKIFTYNTRYTVAEVHFEREKNLDMVNLDFIIRSYDNRNFDRIEDFFFGAKSDLIKMRRELTLLTKRAHKSNSNKKNLSMFRKGKERIMKIFHYSLTGMFIQMCYAAQFYFIHNPPEEVISPEQITLPSGEKKVKSIYKYTGYVKLSDKKVYKQEDRDPDAPVREYQRHIQKWSVRGHYRRVNGNLVWIDPHTKGHGELEKRIYGTLNEDEVDVIPQIFEVQRTVHQSVNFHLEQHKGVVYHADIIAVDDYNREKKEPLGAIVVHREPNILAPKRRIFFGIISKEKANNILHFFKQLFKFN